MTLLHSKNKSYIEQDLKASCDDLSNFPKYIHIETINQCNARCPMCGINFDQKDNQSMSNDLFKKIATEIIDNKKHVRKVMLYLDGEPLLDRSLEEKISILSSHGIKVNISSNMSLMNKKRSKTLIESGIAEVYCSIDSLDKEEYEKSRVHLNFEKVIENTLEFIKMRNTLKKDLKIRIQMIRKEKNPEKEKSYYNFWNQHLNPGLDEVTIQRMHNWANEVETKAEDVTDINETPCIAPFGTLVIHADGTVPLCCMDTKSKYKICDLNRYSLGQAWHSANMNTYRDKHLEGKRSDINICDGCDLWVPNKKRSLRPL